jgi:serine/threonine protein kinase
MIMGTPGYMPPEQARGESVDKRADIWAFGVLLYEMLAGIRPFGGKTASDRLAAVIKDEPDWTRVPLETRRLLRACLEKDPNRRLRDAGDVAYLLDPGEAAAAMPARP